MKDNLLSIIVTKRWTVMEVKYMAKCPKCGMEVHNPRKTWKMAGRPDKSGKRNELTIGLYDHCGKSFRVVLNKRKI